MANLKHLLRSYFKTPIHDIFSLQKRILSVFLEISIGKRLFLKCLLLCTNRFSEILCNKHLRQPNILTLLQHSTYHQLSENVCLMCSAIHHRYTVCHGMVQLYRVSFEGLVRFCVMAVMASRVLKISQNDRVQKKQFVIARP